MTSGGYTAALPRSTSTRGRWRAILDNRQRELPPRTTRPAWADSKAVGTEAGHSRASPPRSARSARRGTPGLSAPPDPYNVGVDPANRPLHVRSGSKPTNWFHEHDFRFLANADETGGTYSIMEIVSPPGSGPEPHRHIAEEEAFYVLDGELTFHVDDQSFEVSPGDLIHVPRGTRHWFKVKERPAKYLALYAPGGEERTFLSEP